MKFKKIAGMLGGLAMSVAVALSSMPLPVLAVESGIETEKDKIEENEDEEETEKEESKDEDETDEDETDEEETEKEESEDEEKSEYEEELQDDEEAKEDARQEDGSNIIKVKAPNRIVTVGSEITEDERNTMLMMYLERELLGESDVAVAAYSNEYPREGLSENSKIIFDELVSMAEEVAQGNRSNTEITIPIEEFGIGQLLSSEDLGGVTLVYEDDSGEDSITNEAFEAFIKKCDIDITQVIYALKSDCPADVYWWNIMNFEVGVSGLEIEYKDDEDVPYLKIPDGAYFTFGLGVDSKYSPDDEDETKGFKVDTDKIKQVNYAIKNANGIVEAAASINGDKNKMEYYAEELCKLNEYNYAAFEQMTNSSNGTDDMNPWQIIYMFDDDTSTNVVCEGYAKSFKLLCDMTKFADSSIQCYIVEGDFGGDHMWNIVHMGEYNYLVDLTNSDDNVRFGGNGLYNGELFFREPDSGSVADGYTYSNIFGGKEQTYTYKKEYIALYNGESDDSILKLKLKDEDEQDTVDTEDVNIPTSSKEYAANGLTSRGKLVYDATKKMLLRVTNGYQDRAVAEISVNDFIGNEGKSEWTVSDFGFSEDDIVDSDGKLTSAAKDVFANELGMENDFMSAFSALVYDYPYEMFWYGPAYNEGQISSIEFDVTGVKIENGIVCFDDAVLQVEIVVAKSYRKSNGDNYDVDTNKISDAVKSLNYAKQIVNGAKAMSDYDKLYYYAKTIADSNEYNYEAANSLISGDMSTIVDFYDPWQIAYVFDKNPDTRFVCEGYAKAFKYLCDLTDFDSDEISCITVNGTLYAAGQAVPHMYNIVHMDDGRNYLVDVTTCDQDGYGIFYKETFIGSTTMTADIDGYYGGYVFNDGNIIYGYDGQTWNLYDEEQLKISDIPYGEETSDTGDSVEQGKPSESEDSTTEETPTEASNSEDSSSNEKTEIAPASTVVSNEPIVEDSKGWDSFEDKVEKAIENALIENAVVENSTDGTEMAQAPVVVNVDLNGTDTIPAKVISTIAEKNVTMAVKVDKNTLVTIDGSKITPAETSEVKLISSKNADGSETVGVRSQNVDIEKNIVIYRNVGLENVGSSTVLYFENADKSLLEFRTSPVYENGFAAFEVPFVNANYKVALK
jgi:hypothetical protein